MLQENNSDKKYDAHHKIHHKSTQGLKTMKLQLLNEIHYFHLNEKWKNIFLGVFI